jgi:acid stress chaperone HdeB
MKKCAFSILLVYSLGFGASFAQTQAAQIQIVDISKITCNDFLKGSLGDIAIVSVWLSGYYHGRVHDTKIDLKKYVENSKIVADACASDLKQTVMQAIAKQTRTEKIRTTPPPSTNEKKG